MIDTAQLREALDTQGAFSGPKTPEQSNLVYAAAMKYLALKEAGALIITPEGGEWPMWAIEAIAFAHFLYYSKTDRYLLDPLGHVRRLWDENALPREKAEALEKAAVSLDALRDAMPDGETP